MTLETKVDWKKLSAENLKITQIIIEITVDFFQLQPINKFPSYTKIPLQKFQSKQVTFDDINHILNKIDGIIVRNEEKQHQLEQETERLTSFEIMSLNKEWDMEKLKLRKEELKNYVFLLINSTDELYRVKKLIDKLLKNDTEVIKIVKSKTNDKEVKSNKSIDGNLKPETIIGKLVAYSDGSIRYGNKIIKLRSQLNDLCRQFMKKPDSLITIDDIRDNIIKASKRDSTEYQTIAKYVSALHKSLKIHFNEDIIFNQKNEGWYFKPPK